MRTIRFTVIGDQGTEYSWIEKYPERDREFYDRHESGTFLGKSEEVVGILECLWQGEDCPPRFYRENIALVMVEKRGPVPDAENT